MIKVFKFNADKYAISLSHLNTTHYTRHETIVQLLSEGIGLKEIEVALDEMDKMDHNYCEFGVNRMFVFSRNFEDKSPSTLNH